MKKFNIISFLIISVLGTLCHFVYDWSGSNKFIGYFTAVNESTWEHLKLLFFPSILYFVFEYFILKNHPKNFIPATAIGIIFGLVSIVVIFYSYRGIIGFNIDFINIFIYYLGVAIMIAIRTLIIKNNWLISKIWNILFLFIIIIIGISFIVFTYSPPSIPLFTPPMEN